MKLLLDDKTFEAVDQLATHFGCSISEAVQRAVISYRNTVFGVSAETRQRRVKTLHRLFDLFEGHDADEEIHRLKAADE